MARTHAYAPSGERVVDQIPRNRGKVLTVIGAMRTSGETHLMTIDVGTSGDVFRSYVECVLVPELRPGDIVVMDNLGAHKVKAARVLIESAGAHVHWLPPYSPETNPIELFWSWMKAKLRTLRARSREALDQGIRTIASELTDVIAQGWTKHCGYKDLRT